MSRKAGGTSMEDKAEVPTPLNITVVIPETTDLPLLHVNALNVRLTADEFFWTLGVVMPPEFRTEEEAQKASPQLLAQPVFRFAVSRQTMARFIDLIQAQFQQQSALLERMALEHEAPGRKRAQNQTEARGE
jgi:hypothetical protein